MFDDVGYRIYVTVVTLNNFRDSENFSEYIKNILVYHVLQLFMVTQILDH